MKKLIIKLLFKLLDKNETYQDIDDKRINEWLFQQFSNIGFREYFRKRDLQLLKTMGVGLDREHYLIYLGQRLELMNLLNKVNQSNKKDRANKKGRKK